MQAIVQTGYGSADVLALAEVDRPAVADNEILVRVHAAAVHIGDVFAVRGIPYMTRLFVGFPKPKPDHVVGSDVAGIVEAVGRNVTQFRPGDEVFGEPERALAQYVSAGADTFAHKPDNLTMEQAAAVPVSALTALQGLRDQGNVQPGQHVLINGASGGVGPYAVQIAKALGAEVTGVCSTRNVETIRSIGADHVIDYTQEDFTTGDTRYDVIFDNVASRPLSACRRVLKPTGVHIPSSGHRGLGWIIKAFVVSLFVRQQGRPFMSVPSTKDLVVLKELIESGKVTPVIDRTYPFSQGIEAFRYMDKGHARGKIVVSMDMAGA